MRGKLSLEPDGQAATRILVFRGPAESFFVFYLLAQVPSVYDACDRFKDLGVTFQKSPNSGGMKGLAFIKDPDG